MKSQMEKAPAVFITLKENVFAAKCGRCCVVSRLNEVPAIFFKYPTGFFVPAFSRLISQF